MKTKDKLAAKIIVGICVAGLISTFVFHVIQMRQMEPMISYFLEGANEQVSPSEITKDTCKLCNGFPMPGDQGRMGLIGINKWEKYTLKTGNFTRADGEGSGYMVIGSSNSDSGSLIEFNHHNSAKSPQNNYSEAYIKVSKDGQADKQEMRKYLCDDCIDLICRVSGGFDVVLVDYQTGDIYPVWPDNSKIICGDHRTDIKVSSTEIRIVTSFAG